MVQNERENRDFSVKASDINFLKSIETARKMTETASCTSNMSFIMLLLSRQLQWVY